jgi:ATP-binding cassette subfamily B protein
LWAELKTVISRARQVFRLVSPRRKKTLLLATGVMLLASISTNLIPILLGSLINTVQGHLASDWLSTFPLRMGGLYDDVAQYAIRTEAGGPVTSVPLPSTRHGFRLPDSLLFRVCTVYLTMAGMAYVLQESLKVARRYLVERTCTQLEKETSVALVGHLLKVDLSSLSQERVGALHGRIHRSVEGFVKFVKLSFSDFFPALSMTAVALVMAWLKNPTIALVIGGVIPVALIITIFQIRSQKGIRVQLLRTKEGMDGTVVEQLAGIEYIRAANTHPIEARRVENVAEERRAKAIRHHVAMALFDCAKALNEGLFHILVIVVAILMAVNGAIEVGDILTFYGLLAGVMAPLREVHRILDDAHESSLQVGDLMKMMAEPVDKSFALPTLRHPQLALGEPVFVAEGLTVDYKTPAGKVRRAISDVSMIIRHGETIGTAGRSGSGKSTWLKVAMRLIHPTAGRVVLGGEPIEAVSREVIGNLIGYVSQTPFVFAGSVEDNISYGSPQATPDDIRKAAQMACIHDEIMAMPSGYKTHLTERGGNLSGGQRQRIALARIFLKNPPILILDEGTSALDNISENAVQRALEAARADRTVIMVAHRLSTLRGADRIFVFDEGRIVEEGTFDELLGKGGVFTELVHSAGAGVGG